MSTTVDDTRETEASPKNVSQSMKVDKLISNNFDASQSVLLGAADIDSFLEDDDAQVISYKVSIKDQNNMMREGYIAMDSGENIWGSRIDEKEGNMGWLYYIILILTFVFTFVYLLNYNKLQGKAGGVSETVSAS